MGRFSGKRGSGASRWQDYQTGAAGGAARKAGGFRGGSQAGATRTVTTGQRTSRVILWGGIGGALVAVLIAILMNLPHPTPVIVLAVTDYAGEFAPPNAYAVEDREGLEGLLTPRGWTYRDYRLHTVDRDRNRAETVRSSLLGELEETADSETVVIYLSAHGAVDHAGRAVLLNENFNPDDLTGLDDAAKRDYPHWTPVEQLLSDIRDKLPAATKKIVFVDANRIPLYWQLAIGDSQFENSFAAALDTTVSNAKVPNLYVINSASPGQIGWAAPELGGSVFGYYVARGLAGGADVDTSGEIMLDELLHYVRERVTRWVETNRLAAQVPAIYGLAEPEEGGSRRIPKVKVADASAPHLLEVVSSGGDTRPLDQYVTSRAAGGLESIGKSRAELDDLWSRHGELAPYYSAGSEEGDVLPAFSRHPAKWARLELLLVRAEQYLFAGRAYLEKHLSEAIDEAKRILVELEASPDAAPPVSLPLAKQTGATGYHELAERLETAASGRLSREDLSRLVEDLNSASTTTPEPVEPLFVRMLDAHDAHLPPNLDLSRIVPVALQVRLLAEQVAAPADVRALPWARERLDDAREERRRQLEDRLFLGTEDGHQLAELSRSYEDLRQEHTAAAERVQQVVRAYRVRDEAVTALPHLAQWHLMGAGIAAKSNRSALAGGSEPTTAGHRQQLKLVSEWRDQAEAVGKELIRRAATVGDELPDLAEMYTSIGKIPGQFRGQAGDEEQPRQMWLALQTPLLTGSDRSDVRERFLKLLQERSKTTPADEQLPAVPAEIAAADSGRDGSSGDWNAARTAFFASGIAASGGTSTDPRDRLERQDHEARAGATAAAFRREYKERTPTLLKLNRYRQFVWLARRATDDFWGPSPAPGAAADGKPYFQQVAAECLAHIERARSVVRDLGERLPDEDTEEELKSTLRARAAASRQGIKFSPASSLRAERSNPLLVQYPSAGLPVGQAVASTSPEFELSVADQTGKLVALGTQSPPSGCTLLYRGDLASKEQKSATLAVLFRGHVWTSRELQLPTGAFRTVEWTKPEPALTRVTVEGEAKQVPYVLFVLDCSDSMRANFASQGAVTTRMEAAKGALDKVVGSLLQDAGNFEIGLVLYGRRYGEVPDPQGGYKPMSVSGLDVSWPDVLNDVELRFTRLPLNRQTVAQLQKVLGEVSHFGITPLYHAIREGLKNSRLAPDQLMQVVVITDGADTQFQYKEYLQKAGKLGANFSTTNEHDVRDALEELGKRVRLDFLGLDFNRTDAAIKALETLAGETGGRFHDVRNTLDLETAIQGLLRPAQFSVRPAGRGEAREAPIDLGDTWALSEQDLSSGQEFIVDMHRVENPPRARFLLEGREHLRLTYRRDSSISSSLVHSRYEGIPAVGSVVIVQDVANPLARRAAFSPAACYVAAHSPDRDRNGAVMFRVSVQNQEEQEFSLRPRHVWAEIRPWLNDPPRDQWPVYPFYDVKFEEGTPVPVLTFTIPDWNWNVTDAEIQLWCTYERELEVRELPLRISGDAPEDQELGGVSTLPGVNFEAQLIKRNEAQQFQVIVSEYHNEQPLDLYSARVQMSPEPDAVRHMYYIQSNLVRHEFTFENATVLGVEEAKILITPRDAIRSPQRAVVVDGRSINDRPIGPLRIRVPPRP